MDRRILVRGNVFRLVIALLCASAVLIVLITPAFDELPGTPAHLLHHAAALTVTAVPLLFDVTLQLLRSAYAPGSLLRVLDLLSLTCTLLC
jgi:hypothetical protein